ncbi:MAG TPA: hypothetical protein VLD39_16370 [Gammaproteobacteria bacterium]|nr:hypothetical protein [Gammaproteobacteria bacterium]
MLRTLVVCGLLLGACGAYADVLLIDEIAAARASAGQRPARGTSMDSVEARFGAPSLRQPAVGEPPIARWEYPGFVVFFEHQLVIHAVAVP